MCFLYRSASTFEMYQEGFRAALLGGRSLWTKGPPLRVAGCKPAWERFPEGAGWLRHAAEPEVWRYTRSYHDLGVPRHELMKERWTVIATVDFFHVQLSVQETMLLRTMASPTASGADGQARLGRDRSFFHSFAMVVLTGPPVCFFRE